MAPPLALGEVPEEVRMNKLLGMNAPPAAKVYNEKERYHVEWKAVWKSTSASGADAAVLAPSSGEKRAPPRYRAAIASIAWRSTRRFSTNAP